MVDSYSRENVLSLFCLVLFAWLEEVKRTTQMVLIFTKQFTSLNLNFRWIEDELFSVIPKIAGLIYYIYYTIYHLSIYDYSKSEVILL